MADQQQNLFDVDEALRRVRAKRQSAPSTETDMSKAHGEALKKAGMKAARAARKFQLERAQEIAVRICVAKDTVCADDVYEKMLEMQLNPQLLGNAWGSVFKKDFIFSRWVTSRRASNHARMIREWRLK